MTTQISNCKTRRRKQRRTLADVQRELIARRIHAFFAWRLALARFWKIDLLWNALKLRWAYRRRERALAALLRNRMSPDWQSALPKKKQRQLGLLPKLQRI